MSNKKINCKSGLERREEIQARRLKDKIIARDEEVLNKIRNLYFDFCDDIKSDFLFLEFLKEKDIVLYSAFKRSGLTLVDIINN